VSLPPEIHKKVKLLEISTRKLVNSIFAGQYHSAFKGQGMTFSDFREYVAGDDVRDISWSLTARAGKPYIKKYEEERELTMILAVAEFLRADKTDLHAFLSHPLVVEWQTEHMLERMRLSLSKILTAIESEKPAGRKKARQVYRELQRLLASPDGVLALIDYVNFKGEGLTPTEVSPIGQFPWGLKTVLEKMAEIKPQTLVCNKKDWRHYNESKCANYAFAEAALWSLTRLTQNWGPEGSESRALREKWLQGGWSRRVRETYLPGSLDRVTCEI
jgi:hypothetical protein